MAEESDVRRMMAGSQWTEKIADEMYNKSSLASPVFPGRFDDGEDDYEDVHTPGQHQLALTMTYKDKQL